MALGWTAKIGASGAALTDYGSPSDLIWVRRFNAVGHFQAILPDIGALAVPTAEQVIRFIWDPGGANERAFFEGVVYDVRRMEGRPGCILIRGTDALGPLWKGTIGTFRDYRDQTPYTIIQSAGSPRGLTYNSQNALVMAYGTAAAVPNKVDGGTPGTALTFRADGDKCLHSIQRLALQARYDGASYGLEFFARFEGANNSTPTFYLVKRRARAAAYTPEVWIIPDDLIQSRRGFEGLTAAQALRVAGAGDGQGKVASSLVGAGNLEGVVADKTIVDPTAAGNMANRLTELLNPSTEVVFGGTAKHAFSTEIGDDCTIRQTGRADVTLRLYEMTYHMGRKMFYLTFGRPQPRQDTALDRVDKAAMGQAHGPQRVASRPTSSTMPQQLGPTNLAANTTLGSVTQTFNLADYFEYRDEGIEATVVLQANTTVSATDVMALDVRLTLVHNLGTTVIWQERKFLVRSLFTTGAPVLGDLYVAAFTISFHKGLLDDLVSAGFLTNATALTITVTNRSFDPGTGAGVAADNVFAKLYSHIMG